MSRPIPRQVHCMLHALIVGDVMAVTPPAGVHGKVSGEVHGIDFGGICSHSELDVDKEK